jgi:hypothetical protein
VITQFGGASFIGEGDEDTLEEGKATTIEPNRLAGKHRDQVPLNDEVVEFN